MLSTGAQRTISEAAYVFLILVTVILTGLSCAGIISQAVRTSPTRSWARNFNALMVGGSYVVLLAVSLLFCVKRRVAVRLKLRGISKTYRTINRDDLPKKVHKYVVQEYIRACLVSYESLPRNVFHEGWGRPGTAYSGISFRRTLLDTIRRIGLVSMSTNPELLHESYLGLTHHSFTFSDELARVVIPHTPRLKPHARMLHHFRFLLPLLPKDEDGMTPLHYYDSAIQLARNSGTPLTEEEFETGMEAAYQIDQSLNECRLEMLESDSQTQFGINDSPHK
ncbi:hypothetical protein D9619_003031 [Psilocybe cf. subviscida]|uniref:Defect at low temperature protein 1 n=1 Tax=Psilocybe cf. subviscida TaxID=2480587 RepID=A0A8H5AYH6_9AGAR|nr:hypothetical protein D9619_003031 [Psilocybe cf. subviscida]